MRNNGSQNPGYRGDALTPTSSPNFGSQAAPDYQYAEDFFVYGASFGTLAQGVGGVQNITIQADSDFEAIKIAVGGTLTGNGGPFTDSQFPELSMQLVDTGSGRQLFNTPVPIQLVAGSAGLPLILPVPRLFKSKSVLQVTATNIAVGAHSYDNCFVAFIGRKIFEFNQSK